MLKALLVWFMLLAVPFQGFASATMLLCAPLPLPLSSAPGVQHGQHAGSAHQHHQAGAVADQSDHHAGGKCGSCAECCIGALIAPSCLPSLPVAAPHYVAIPFDMGEVPSVDLAFPERPPRFAR
ncbi:MAG: hypothetical protein WA191_24345 [Telluria sp.]|nr:hypothetical protein [Telluria sp.]